MTSYAPRQQPAVKPGQLAAPSPTRRLPEQATINGTRPAPAYDRRVPTSELLPDLALYERLISEGAATADAQGRPVDHVTARRLAIWLAARPQDASFAQGLARFINTGAIQRDLKNQLRLHARSSNHDDHAQAARLLRYYLARETDPGPIGASFGAACHQLDRSDLMLAGARDRTSQSTGRRTRQSEQDTGEPGIIALASYDPDGQTVTLVLDAATANTAIYAMAAHAQEREAHLREIQLQAQGLPEGSYGRRNRQAIADRETRVTTRLRSIEQAYQTAIEHGTTARTPGPAERFCPPDRAAGQEIDLEAEP